MSTQTSANSTLQRDEIAEEKMIRLMPDVNNKNFVTDAAHAIQICRKFLTVLGIWTPIDSSIFSWRTVLGHIIVVICYFGIGIRGIPSVLYLILDEKRPIEKLRLIVRCLFVFMGATKYTYLRIYRQKIQNCMKHIEHDWIKVECTESRDIMLEHARFGHLVTRVCIGFTYSGATFLAVLPIVLGNLLADKTQHVNTTETVTVRRFAVPSHFGLSVFNKSPIYEIIYWSQVLASFLLHTIGVACYSLAVVIVMHACGQLKILMGKLNELVDGGGKVTMYDTVNSRMSDIIQHHVTALRFVSSAEKMLRGICLVDLGCQTFSMCCLGYFCLLEFKTDTRHPIAICAWTTILVTCVFNVFSFCYIGELLTQECAKVGEATYLIDWYRLPGNKSLDLGLVITMAHSPMSLTAGGAIQLSMTCFATVIRTVLGYVNMLRTVMN